MEKIIAAFSSRNATGFRSAQLFFFCFSLFTFSFSLLNAQTIEMGLRGGIDSFWLLNSNTSNIGNSQSTKLSLSYNGGLHLAYDITDNVGIETNFMYASLNQGYSGSFTNAGILPGGELYQNGQSYSSMINVTAYQIPLLVCLETNSGSFVELGAEYDMIKGASYTSTYSNPSESFNNNVINYFATSNIAGVFGVGGKYSVNDYIFILTDLRVTYGFSDIKGVDGLGQSYSITPYYSSYKPTTAVNASLNIGVFYLLALTPTYQVGHKCKGSPKVRSTRKRPS
ncbi:MAG: hypothetical protein ACLQQ4_12985 [Bacteroidia bacterium]